MGNGELQYTFNYVFSNDYNALTLTNTAGNTGYDYIKQ